MVAILSRGMVPSSDIIRFPLAVQRDTDEMNYIHDIDDDMIG